MSQTSPRAASRPRSRGSLIIWTLIAVFSSSAIAFSHWLNQPIVDNDDQTLFLQRFSGGTLLIAGGGPLPLEIRQTFVDLAGGQRAKLVVIPSYDANPFQLESMKHSWSELGIDTVQVLHTTSREQANQVEFAQAIAQATGVWLGGGSQEWLSRHYVGTRVEEELHALLARGGIVGGTSAGAAAMTKVMIEQGADEAVEGVGFDLFQDAVIDQHFLRRSRLNRLIGLMASHPDRIAFGVDEDTALVVQIPKGRLAVIGSSYVVAYIPKTGQGEARFEILKRRDHIDLDGLKSGTIRVSSTMDIDEALGE